MAPGHLLLFRVFRVEEKVHQANAIDLNVTINPSQFDRLSLITGPGDKCLDSDVRYDRRRTEVFEPFQRSLGIEPSLHPDRQPSELDLCLYRHIVALRLTEASPHLTEKLSCEARNRSLNQSQESGVASPCNQRFLRWRRRPARVAFRGLRQFRKDRGAANISQALTPPYEAQTAVRRVCGRVDSLPGFQRS